ncbi:MAG: hypothetical protein RL536_369 [Candidatus Parcubacteria bacterium]|jgi:S1-C subfamily serine protease
MEQLSKHQLILVALLVSFVTSLATGIFTVSLMNQAPQSVVQTINQVVEKMVTPQNATVTTALAPKVEDKVPSAVENVTKSIVKLHVANSSTVLGLGVVVSKTGVVITDKSVVNESTQIRAFFADGRDVQMILIQSQINGDVVFLIPTANSVQVFTPITFSPNPKIGQTVLSLFKAKSEGNEATESLFLAQGIISRTLIDQINPDGSQPARIDTNISRTSIADPKNILGSPLFNLDGEVIGINTKTVSKESTTADFYPIMQLKGAIPKAQ